MLPCDYHKQGLAFKTAVHKNEVFCLNMYLGSDSHCTVVLAKTYKDLFCTEYRLKELPQKVIYYNCLLQLAFKQKSTKSD